MLQTQDADVNDYILLNDVAGDNNETCGYVGDNEAVEEPVINKTMYALNTEDEMQEFLIMEVQAHEAIWNCQYIRYHGPVV